MVAKVADASVIAALAFGEPRAEEAMLLLRGATLYEPLLLSFELVSVARKKALENREQAGTIKRALTLALEMDIRWSETDFSDVFRLALNTDLTTYDAVYLSLACRLGVPLITFDKGLAAAAQC